MSTTQPHAITDESQDLPSNNKRRSPSLDSSACSSISSTWEESPEYRKKRNGNPMTSFHLSKDIFGWSLVCTDFEHFSDFLKLLNSANDLLCSSFSANSPFPYSLPIQSSLRSHPDRALQFKQLLWSLFAGFRTWSMLDFSEDERMTDKAGSLDAIKCYISLLNEHEKSVYDQGTFSQRYEVLKKLTSKCPVRLYLMSALHQRLCTSEKRQPSVADELSDFVPRLSASIIINKWGVPYCRLRSRAVHKKCQTSRLTRQYREDVFLRVTFDHASVSMDIRTRLETPDHLESHLDGTDELIQDISILKHTALELSKCLLQPLRDEDAKVNEKKWPLALPHASRFPSSFDPIEEQEQLSNQLRNTYNQIFDNGFSIAGRHFTYLVTTSGGVHKNMHTFYGSDTKSSTASSESLNLFSETVEEADLVNNNNLRQNLFSKADTEKLMHSPLKMSLRIGLWLTSSVSEPLVDAKLVKLKDIGSHTDGCGRISLDLATRMTSTWKQYRTHMNASLNTQSGRPAEWNETTEHDSEIEYSVGSQFETECYTAFQIRLDGIKGMLVSDHALPDNTIYVSESMIKFELNDDVNPVCRSIEIVQCSQATQSARLNFALITLIDGCANDPSEMQAYIAGLAEPEISKLLNEENKEAAIQFAVACNDVMSFNMLGGRCTAKQVFLAGYYQNYARRFKVIVKESRRLFGVADFWGVLKEGEVYVNISGVGELDCEVLVTKEPCYHRGDLRKLTAVKHRFDKHFSDVNQGQLKDIIVFSCQGSRAEANKISGSDLDGDQYFVCWDQKIVSGVKTFEPALFDEDKPIPSTTLVDGRVSSPLNTTEDIDKEKKITYRRQLRNKFKFYRNYCLYNSDEWPNPGVVGTFHDFWKNFFRWSADEAMKAQGIDLTFVSVHDIFDLRLRIVDSLGGEWTSQQNQALMSRLGTAISDALDCPKTNRFVNIYDWSSLWKDDSLPKYPHYHPMKSRLECQYSHSSPGYVHDNIADLVHGIRATVQPGSCPSEGDMRLTFVRTFNLPKEVFVHIVTIEEVPRTLFEERQILKEDPNELGTFFLTFPNLLKDVQYAVVIYSADKSIQLFDRVIKISSPREDSDSTEQCPDSTLFDAIRDLKLSFLFHYANVQAPDNCLDPTSSPTIGHQNPALPILTWDELLRWFESGVPSKSFSLAREEAVCTLLGRFMALRVLMPKCCENLDIAIVYLKEGMSLKQIDSATMKCISSHVRNFFCVDEKLLEHLYRSYNLPCAIKTQIVKANETYQVLSSSDTAKLIECLKASLASSFWNDLGLPCPDLVRHLQSPINSQIPMTFKDNYELVREYTKRLLDEPVSYNPKTRAFQIENNRVEPMFSELRDFVGGILCFRQLWAKPDLLANLRVQLAAVADRYTRMFEYMSVVKCIQQRHSVKYKEANIADKAIDVSGKEEDSDESEEDERLKLGKEKEKQRIKARKRHAKSVDEKFHRLMSSFSLQGREESYILSDFEAGQFDKLHALLLSDYPDSLIVPSLFSYLT